MRRLFPFPVSAVIVRSPYGRFGNQYFQTLNAIIFARRIGARTIIWAKGHHFLGQRNAQLTPDLNLVLDRKDYSDVSRRFDLRASTHASVHLAVNTYFLLERGELNTSISQIEFDRASAAIRDALDFEKSNIVSEETLVIHLRAGDIFGENPHSAYGQPPIGFYQFVMDYKPWKRILVVREDASNPVESKIALASRKRRIPIEFRSGSFEEDFGYLINSPYLVASRGTLIPAVAGLSRELKSVFVFWPNLDKLPSPENLLGPAQGYPGSVKQIRITDRDGTFSRQVCDDNWTAGDEQRELIVTYGKSRMVEVSD